MCDHFVLKNVEKSIINRGYQCKDLKKEVRYATVRSFTSYIKGKANRNNF